MDQCAVAGSHRAARHSSGEHESRALFVGSSSPHLHFLLPIERRALVLRCLEIPALTCRLPPVVPSRCRVLTMLSRRAKAKAEAAADRETAAAAAAVERQVKAVSAKVQSESSLARTGVQTDLDHKLGGWKAQQETLYGGASPSASVTVTVLAATGLATAEPFWIAAVAGESAETGGATHFETGLESAPRGAPSWSSEPLTLAVHDVTSDLLLLLCDTNGGDGARRCVGRVVVPLSDLLPLSPFGSNATPASQMWAAIFCPGPEYAPGTVYPLLTSAVDGVPGAGLIPPNALPSLVQGAALLRIEYSMHTSLASALLLSPPFDPTLVPSIDPVAQRPIVPPERVLLAAHRLGTALNGLPALIRVLATKPWTAGLTLLALTGWLLFGCSPPLLPWWSLTAWLCNGVAIRFLVTPSAPWEPARPGGYRTFTLSSADEKLALLERALAPYLGVIETAASSLERLATAPAALEPRVALLAALPLLLLTGLVSVAFAAGWLVVSLLGGLRSFFFLAVALCLTLNAATFHRNEIYAWLGARGMAGDGVELLDDEETAAGGGSGPRRGGSGSPGGGVRPLAAWTDPAVATNALLPPHGASSSSVSFEDDTWLGDATRTLATAGLSLSASAYAIVSNLAGRFPDDPTATNRAIARSAMQPDTRAARAE